ncbi:bark storage protein A-like [Tasmannia lanceolata]|uniref:bark storage protein A-like n=1 Tax=Tasmannia lanceolata TaxID=3420 RepID=UPI0040632BC0
MDAKEVKLRGVVVVMVLSLLLVCDSEALPIDKKSRATIREMNRHGPYVGLITVYPPEEEAFFSTRTFHPHARHPFVDLSGRRFRAGKVHGKNVIYVRCGIGMRNAAATTQQMVDLFDVFGIVHFGIAGNVNSSLSIGDVSVPKFVAQTGIWEWLKFNGTLTNSSAAHFDIGDYNLPKGKGINLLGRVGYWPEEYYSVITKPNTPQDLVWAEMTPHWLHLASNMENMGLDRCLNSSVCLPKRPKVVMGLRGSTANIFVDNPEYRNFLFKAYGVSSVDMESAAVAMTSLSNGFPVIVIRSLSDMAGGQAGKNAIELFGPLAAINAAKAAVQFIKMLP